MPYAKSRMGSWVVLCSPYSPEAYGLWDWAKAIEALETYLRLMPDAENRAQVEADIQEMRRIANDPIAGIQIPEGKTSH